MSRKALNPGERFGDCTVERSLGAGGMGSVYLVRSPGGTPYALKLLDPEMAKIVGKEFDALVETEQKVFAGN